MILLAMLLGSATLVTAPSAHANPALNGIWRVTVMKKGTERVKLDGYSLLLAFQAGDKTWSAETKSDAGSSITKGSYQIEGSVVTLSANGRTHPMTLVIDGNTLVIIPKSEPTMRLIALRVK
jgi:hypothetical protein